MTSAFAAAEPTCNSQFLAKFTANYLRLGCIKDIPGACGKFEQVDDRKIVKKREIRDIDQMPEFKDIKASEVAGIVRQLASYAVGRNPWYMGGKLALSTSPAGGPCDGPAYFYEDGVETKVNFYSGDKFVKKLSRPNDCRADFDIWDNQPVTNFFSLSKTSEQLAAMKDKSTCHYLTKINKLVADENAKDSSMESSRKTRASGKGQGRN